jgi:hypothetical protein
MVDRGNVNKHRTSMSGLKVTETEKWGRTTARERYGSPQYYTGAPSPRDQSQPQFKEDRPDKAYQNNHRQDWVVGANEDATKPGFDRSKGKR